MDAKELRIGNWIHDQDGDISQIDSGEYIDLFSKEFTPIKLTPEILEKCGFMIEHDCASKNIHKRKTTYLEIYKDYYVLCDDSYHSEVEIKINTKIDYLHQLQNLYFALTGEELKVNLTEPVSGF